MSMQGLNLEEVSEWVNRNIVTFHENKIKILKQLTLNKALRHKNPYLFRAKNISLAQELVKEVLNAYLSSSEEKLFGDFLEDLAIFIAGKTCGGKKSSATGIDLEFENNNIHYLVSIKSGTNWGNSSQQRKQQEDFDKAVRVVKQSSHVKNVQAVLGICYGKTRTTYVRNYLKVVGQNFWYFISGNKELYIDIIKPLGYGAKEHNDAYLEKKVRVINQFTQELLANYCSNGIIDWHKIVKLNSGNFDWDKHCF